MIDAWFGLEDAPPMAVEHFVAAVLPVAALAAMFVLLVVALAYMAWRRRRDWE